MLQTLLSSTKTYGHIEMLSQNIIQRRKPLQYNSEILEVHSESNKSPCAAFQASHCYMPRAHKTGVVR